MPSTSSALTNPPGLTRRTIAATLALVGTIVWTHALAGAARGAVGLTPADVAPASLGLTLGAVAAALAGAVGHGARWRAVGRSALAGLSAAGVIAWRDPIAWVPALAIVPASAAFAAVGAELARRLPERIDRVATRRPMGVALWVCVALLAVVQVGRLSTFMTDTSSDWFLSTRDPFYAKHDCLSAYVYGAELNRRGEDNVYDPQHYPGLNPAASPVTEIVGLVPEDPFQYPPQFLVLPRLAIELTNDYQVIRLLWFGLNVTLCLAAVLALAAWVGGRTGAVAGLLTPALLTSFPVLHNFQYGQFHFATIALAMLGFVAFRVRHVRVGGLLLAVAVLSKMFPAVLLVPLVVRKRWRELGWTLGACGALTGISFALLGVSPFTAFYRQHLPRLANGSAFAFGDAWPEVAELLVAGNQGLRGVIDKLIALGLPVGDGAADLLGVAYGAGLLALAVVGGLRLRKTTRGESAAVWLGLLGLGSLASAGAWADYVPVACVWLLALLAPMTRSRGVTVWLLAICAVLQVSLLGTMPIGTASSASWMLPFSLAGAVSMFSVFGAAATSAWRGESRPATHPRHTAPPGRCRDDVVLGALR